MLLPKIEEYFEEELSWIKNDNYRAFMEFALKNYPPYFMEVPSSSSGKYHSQWSNTKPLGLAKHTKAVALVTKLLAPAYILSEEETDLAIIAALLHDCVKFGFGGGKHTSKTHEFEGATFFARCYKAHKLELPDELYKSVYTAIATHQGQWAVTDPPKKFPEDFDKIGQLLHISDMVASRPGIRFDFLETSLVG